MMNFKPNLYRSMQSFDAVMESAAKWARNLNDYDRKKYTEALAHGAAVLNSKAHLKMYLHEYGRIHQAKLIQAYQYLPKEIWNEDGLSLIDYGCGQGIAEMVLSDFIQSIFVDNNYIKDIHLIDPATVNLNEAEKNARHFFIDAEIHTLSKFAHQLNENDIKVNKNTVLHVLSNVVDLKGFNYTRIIDLLNSDQTHNNIVVCASPYYQENGRGERIDNFGRHLKGFKTHYKFQKHLDDWDKPYSCQIRIYSNYY